MTPLSPKLEPNHWKQLSDIPGTGTYTVNVTNATEKEVIHQRFAEFKNNNENVLKCKSGQKMLDNFYRKLKLIFIILFVDRRKLVYSLIK